MPTTNYQRFITRHQSLCLLLVANLQLSCVAADEHILYADYTADYMANVRGGLNSGAQYLDNFYASYSYLRQSDENEDGTIFHFAMLHNGGSALSQDLIGDLQFADNLDTVAATRLYELWLEAPVSPDGRIRIGRFDLSPSFDSLQSAQLFIQSSHGMGPDFSFSGPNGPSTFPVTSIGVSGLYKLGDWHLKGAVVDSDPGDPARPRANQVNLGGGVLGVIEAQHISAEQHWYLGYWQYSDTFELPFSRNGERQSGNRGVYAAWEYLGTDWQGFARYGYADDQFNLLSGYLGAGIVRRNLFGDHMLGLAVAAAETSDGYRRLFEFDSSSVPNREISIELTYSVPVSAWFAVQLELQRIQDPASLPGISTAYVAGLRIVIQGERTFSAH